MTLMIGHKNQRFDNAEPLYCTTGTEYVWNRHTGKLIEHDTLVAQMAQITYTPKANEIGLPSYGWQQGHTVGPWIGWGESAGGAIPVSNTVTNGEAWTAATGTTPPTGWTDSGVSGYETDGSTLVMTNAAAGADTLTQTQTVVAETDYVCYISIISASGAATVSADGGAEIPVSGMGVVRIPYTMAALDTDADIVLTVTGVGHIEVEYIRNILASEEV